MSAEVVAGRLRKFLLALSCFLCVGTVIELALTGHTKEPIQFLPFVLCAIGLIVLLVALFRPARATLLVLRVVMVIMALGGLFGTYEHVEQNLEFAREVKPAQASASPLLSALTGGNPPLAPGVLGVTGLLALAATYGDSVLHDARRRATEQAGKPASGQVNK
jgi:hypothetical protein